MRWRRATAASSLDFTQILTRPRGCRQSTHPPVANLAAEPRYASCGLRSPVTGQKRRQGDKTGRRARRQVDGAEPRGNQLVTGSQMRQGRWLARPYQETGLSLVPPCQREVKLHIGEPHLGPPGLHPSCPSCCPFVECPPGSPRLASASFARPPIICYMARESRLSEPLVSLSESSCPDGTLGIPIAFLPQTPSRGTDPDQSRQSECVPA